MGDQCQSMVVDYSHVTSGPARDLVDAREVAALLGLSQRSSVAKRLRRFTIFPA